MCSVSASPVMAISETGSVEAEKLAIEQINAAGGVLGRKIKFIQEDGASDWPTFAEKAKKLLVNDKCAAVMGCWTSASRKAVLPVFEQYNGMKFVESIAHRVTVLHQGKVLAEGDMQTVQANPKVKEVYLGH